MTSIACNSPGDTLQTWTRTFHHVNVPRCHIQAQLAHMCHHLTAVLSHWSPLPLDWNFPLALALEFFAQPPGTASTQFVADFFRIITLCMCLRFAFCCHIQRCRRYLLPFAYHTGHHGPRQSRRRKILVKNSVALRKRCTSLRRPLMLRSLAASRGTAPSVGMSRH